MVMRNGLKRAKIKPKFRRMKDFLPNMHEKTILSWLKQKKWKKRGFNDCHTSATISMDEIYPNFGVMAVY